LTIFDQAVGPSDARTASAGTRLAEVMRAIGRETESVKLYARWLPVLETTAGPLDERTQLARSDYARLITASTGRGGKEKRASVTSSLARRP
jgi:hypothetical protein